VGEGAGLRLPSPPFLARSAGEEGGRGGEGEGAREKVVGANHPPFLAAWRSGKGVGEGAGLRLPSPPSSPAARERKGAGGGR